MSKKEEFNKLKVSEEYGGVVGEVPFAKYPRPQLKRDSFFNLNGKWDCGVVVPFPIESDNGGGALRQAQGPQTPQGPQVIIQQADAFELPQILDASLDAIITDPPWGLWEDISDMEGFYKKMFESFKRVLKSDGKMIILSARTKELEAAAAACGLSVQKSLHTLVNGKKATLYCL